MSTIFRGLVDSTALGLAADTESSVARFALSFLLFRSSSAPTSRRTLWHRRRRERNAANLETIQQASMTDVQVRSLDRAATRRNMACTSCVIVRACAPASGKTCVVISHRSTLCLHRDVSTFGGARCRWTGRQCARCMLQLLQLDDERPSAVARSRVFLRRCNARLRLPDFRFAARSSVSCSLSVSARTPDNCVQCVLSAPCPDTVCGADRIVAQAERMLPDVGLAQTDDVRTVPTEDAVRERRSGRDT